MANTYYDSQLTAAEIEAALEAIDGVIEPANNGKVLAIEDGKIVPKSVTDYIDLNLQAKTVTPGASQQVVAPDSGYNGLSTVTVNGDADLVAGNIKKDVNIFGVTGSYEGGSPTLQSKTVTPGASQQTVQPDSGYDGLSSVVVNGDANLVEFNIKKNVTIFGVTGTYESGGGGSTILSGTDSPSDSYGSDGDIYLLYNIVYGGLASGAGNTSYVPLGFYSNDYEVEIDFSFDAPYSSYRPGDSWAFGIYVANNANMIGVANNSIYIGATSQISYKPFNNDIHTVSYLQDRTLFDGAMALSAGLSSLNLQHYAFATDANGSPAGIIPYSTIYNIRCYDKTNGNLVRDYRGYDDGSTQGFEDVLSGVKYPKVGNSELTLTGSTQYIISSAFVKVDGSWRNLIGADIRDVG